MPDETLTPVIAVGDTVLVRRFDPRIGVEYCEALTVVETVWSGFRQFVRVAGQAEKVFLARESVIGRLTPAPTSNA